VGAIAILASPNAILAVGVAFDNGWYDPADGHLGTSPAWEHHPQCTGTAPFSATDLRIKNTSGAMQIATTPKTRNRSKYASDAACTWTVR
jgi:hypothetical protein